MAESYTSLQHLLVSLDPKSLILSQFSQDSEKPNLLQLTPIDLFMERGPKYKAYAELRESKLRLKWLKENPPTDNQEFDLTPPRKQVKFQGNLMGITTTATTPPNRRKGSSALAQSVPDFSAVLRKENRKPRNTMLPPLMEKSATTPPLKCSSKLYGVGAKSGGSKSAIASEKRGGGLLMARKSFVGGDDLKGFSYNAVNAINGENRGGGGGGGGGRKTILGYKQGY